MNKFSSFETIDIDSCGEKLSQPLLPEDDIVQLQTQVTHLSLELKQSREELAHFLTLVEDSPNPICLTGKTEDISLANTSFRDFFQLGSDEVAGTSLFSLFPENRRDRVREALRSLTPGKPSWQSEPMFHEEGRDKCWKRWKLRAFFDESGKPTAYQIQGRDVPNTEECRNLSTSVDAILEAAPMGFAYSEGLVIKRTNQALCKLLGYEEDEIFGMKIPFENLYVDEDETARRTIRKKLGKQESFFRETRLRRKDGTILEAFIFSVPILLDTGQRGHVLFMQDISEHRELEKQRLRTDLVVMRSPVVLFQGRCEKGIPLDYVSANISQFGYRSRDLTDSLTPLDSLVHPADLPLLLTLDARNDRQRKTDREYTYRFRKADGEYRWVNQKSRIVPVADGTGNVLVGILMDVTEQREAQEELTRSHQMLKEQVSRLEKTWEQTIGLLAAVTELRDPYTMGHQRRVADLSGTIAERMGLSPEQVQETIRAALVHDIGKINVPSEYLSKPGKLTHQEFAIITEHARTGAELLEKIDLPWHLANIVAQHHERLDGSGYPEGLKGEEILLPARIIAVADVVEAMASHRPYRPALGLDKALTEITTKAGRLYDSKVVSECRLLFLQKGYQWAGD